jgi:DNA-binding MarR family transcriptional regulator
MATNRKRRLRVLRGSDVPSEGQGHAVVVSIVHVYSRLTEALTRLVKQEGGLTLPHFEVLLTLRMGEGISQQDLSDRLLVTKGNICVIVQKLEAAGLIERRTDPTDQRYHRLYLADAGRRLLAKVGPEHRALTNLVLRGLSLAEQKTLHELLNRIDQTLDDLEM